jgi:hypothetical protein
LRAYNVRWLWHGSIYTHATYRMPFVQRFLRMSKLCSKHVEALDSQQNEWKVHHVGSIILMYCDTRSITILMYWDERSAQHHTDILWCTVSKTLVKSLLSTSQWTHCVILQNQPVKDFPDKLFLLVYELQKTRNQCFRMWTKRTVFATQSSDTWPTTVLGRADK